VAAHLLLLLLRQPEGHSYTRQHGKKNMTLEQARKLKIGALLAVTAVTLIFLIPSLGRCFFFVRAYSPFPVNYVARLKMLENWDTEPGDGLNCSGFISNAHSDRFHTSSDFYLNTFNDLNLIEEIGNRYQINESILAAGDVAAFEGPDWPRAARAGVHVAAYLGHGLWVDADSRRGYVERFRMSDKDSTDQFFTGHVRLYRWKTAERFSFTAATDTLGKDNSAASDLNETHSILEQIVRDLTTRKATTG
jgi:hypothetical protein